MKFSDIKQREWEELKPYLDTCLLPLTALSGDEEPWEVTEALERLRDVMDWIEIPFKGRVVTYPAVHYQFKRSYMEIEFNQLIKRIKSSGFRFVIIVTCDPSLSELTVDAADLMICQQQTGGTDTSDQEEAKEVSRLIQSMWTISN